MRRPTPILTYLFELNVRQHISTRLCGRSWQAELLAQVAKDGRRNTIRTIVIRAFKYQRTQRHFTFEIDA
jgi:hypothetical protein